MNFEKENILADLSLLNLFLYKYFFFFVLVNLILFFFPYENLYILSYLISVIIFVALISKLLKNDFFCFFAQISSLFLIILTQLTFIITYILSKLFYDLSFDNFLNYFFPVILKVML